VDALAALCGTWSTDPAAPGEGICPRGTPVRFHETLVVTRTAPTDGWLTLVQHAVDAASGETLHAEHGFLRPRGAGVELALAMNSGRLEVARGEVVADGDVVCLAVTSDGFLNDRLQVIAMRRTLAFDLAAGTCDKQLELATGLGWPSLTRHMWSRLRRGYPGPP
jgi:hypothetical protein